MASAEAGAGIVREARESPAVGLVKRVERGVLRVGLETDLSKLHCVGFVTIFFQIPTFLL